MRPSDLPTPGVLSNGQALRHLCASAISRAEINHQLSEDGQTAEALLDFFDAAADACADLIPDSE